MNDRAEAWERLTKAAKKDLAQARQMVSLRVNEISVVDRPAIVRRFLVVKRDENMKLKDEEIAASRAEVTKAFEAGGFVLADGKLPERYVQAAKAIVPWLHDMAGQAADEIKPALLDAASMLASFEANKVLTQKAFPPKKDKEEEEKDAKEEADKKKAETARKEKALSLEGVTEGATIKVADDGTVTMVMKGAKVLNNERSAQLSEAAKSMLGLLSESNPELFKATIEQAAEKAGLPNTVNFRSGTIPHGVGAPGTVGTWGVKKDEDGVALALAELKKSVDKNAAELADIKKSRSPSTSVAEDGTTEQPQPTDVKKSMWSSVL